ncbi:MAG: extracellular solute-binding protein [Oscillospiraceae bacterium]|nr:extracellular solute-binding protein [Oscillospiraceae bacterium]
MKFSKIFALALAALMLLTLLAACGGNSATTDDNSSNEPGGNTDPGDSSGGDSSSSLRYNNTRDIYIGQWWDSEYDSNTLEMPEDEADPMVGQMRLDNMRAIEERYNVTFNYVNMTFDGARESLNTSLKAGTPDVDIYTLDTQFMIMPITSGYAIPISDYATDPAYDILNNDEAKNVFTPINIGGMDKDYIFSVTPTINPNAMYMLGFNYDILQAKGQPNPQDLYDAGEWTWQAWMDIMKACTDTTTGTPTYGWSGGHVRFLENLLISNNAHIALGETEEITSAPTREVFDFIDDMYNISQVAKAWSDEGGIFWENGDWSNNDLAFFIFIPWLAQNYGVSQSEDCPYDIRSVPWPTGPTAEAQGGVSATVNLNGNVMMIPVGTPDPEIVFRVYYDFTNWFAGDTSLRDDWTWMEDLFGPDTRGWEYAKKMCEKAQYDMWNDLAMTDENGNGFYIGGIMNGSETPTQFTEKWKNIVQDYINNAFN